jgi:tetratricopeptide (TPR) repeat protein
MISVSCPTCGTALRVKDKMAGKTGKCPKCGEPVRVSSGITAEPPAPLAPPRTVPLPTTGPPLVAPPLREVESARHAPSRKPWFFLLLGFGLACTLGAIGAAVFLRPGKSPEKGREPPIGQKVTERSEPAPNKQLTDLVARADKAFASGDYALALSCYRDAIPLANWKDPVLYLKKGRCQLQQQFGATWAVDDFTEAIKLREDFSAAYLERAVAYSHLGKFKEAIGDLTHAEHTLKVAPEEVGKYALICADGFRAGKEQSSARITYDIAIQHNPKSGPAYAGRALVTLLPNDSEQLIADAQKAVSLGVQLDPELTDRLGRAFLCRADAFRKSGQTKRALEAFNEAVRLAPYLEEHRPVFQDR